MNTQYRSVTLALAASGLVLSACGTAANEPSAISEQGLASTVSIVAAHSGKCVDLSGGDTDAGGAVVQSTCQSTTTQQWTLNKVSGNTYNVISVASGLCLDTSGQSTDNGAPVIEWPCNGQDNQRWAISSAGAGYRLKAVQSGKCMDVTGVSTDDGALIQQWSCHGGRNQTFQLNDAGGGSSSGGTSSGGSGAGCDSPNLQWKTANKTNFTSYPDPGSPECIDYNGCAYEGDFAACSNTESKAWVQAHNIVSVFPDFGSLKLHDVCLKRGSNTIVATVLDECADSDCSGCCTQNLGSADELIDIESFTSDRWGVDDGPIQWADLGPTAGSGCQ